MRIDNNVTGGTRVDREGIARKMRSAKYLLNLRLLSLYLRHAEPRSCSLERSNATVERLAICVTKPCPSAAAEGAIPATRALEHYCGPRETMHSPPDLFLIARGTHPNNF